MGYQVIKQPNGLLCIWSSYSDEIVASDGGPEEIINWFADLAARESKITTERVVNAVINNDAKSVYYQFTKTWEAVRKDYFKFRKGYDAGLRG
jgi:hypothetical protein